METAEQLVGSYYVTALRVRELTKRLREVKCPSEGGGDRSHLGEFFDAEKSGADGKYLGEFETEVAGCRECSELLEVVKERRSERKRLAAIKGKIFRCGKRLIEKAVGNASN